MSREGRKGWYRPGLTGCVTLTRAAISLGGKVQLHCEERLIFVSSQEMKIAKAIGNLQIAERKLDLLTLQFDRMHPGSKLARVQWLSVEDYQIVSYIIPLLRTAVPRRWLVRGIGRGVTRKTPLKWGAKLLT